jgi:hypothetical protein
VIFGIPSLCVYVYIVWIEVPCGELSSKKSVLQKGLRKENGDFLED